jgi:hypothetical protein
MGMNQHGRISIYAFIAVFLIFVISLYFVGINQWELTTAALLFVVPMNIVYGLLIPIYTCRKLNLSWFSYVQSSFIKPLIYITPFLCFLSWSRHAYELNDSVTAITTLIVAGIVTIVVYFVYLVPIKMQLKFLRRLKLKS